LAQNERILRKGLFTFGDSISLFMIFRVLLGLLFLLSSGIAGAQRNERDEPVALLPADSNRVNSLVQETYQLRETNQVRAMEYCLLAIGLAKQLGYKKGEGRALGSLGWIYYRKGDFLKALEISYEALKISEQVGDEAELARSLNNVGAIYFEKNQYRKALEQVERALAIARRIGDDRIIARSLNNMANAYEEMGKNSDSVERYATEALLLSEKTHDNYNGFFANLTLGDLLVRKGEYGKALKKYERSLALSDNNSNEMKMGMWREIAGVYVRQNRVHDAIAILTNNIENAKKYGYREERERSYQLLAEAYKVAGNFPLAFECLQHYTLLHDSVYNEQNASRLASLQSQSDLDIKQAQIELLTKDKLLNKEEISRQRIQLYSTIGGFLGILLIAAILFYGNRKINRTNVLLEQRTAELGDLNTTKDKLFSIISHDFRTPLNSLKGVLTLLENKNISQSEFSELAGKLRKNFNAVSNDLDNLLHWSLAQLQGIQTNSTRINVQPIVQENITVFQEIAKAKDVDLENGISENLFVMADEDHIRLVLRNLINNAIKFTAPGGVVKISSEHERPYVKIVVADTGVGIGSVQLESLFQKDKPVSTIGTNREKGVGLGLLLCQEFVENNGGQLVVASELGKGSVFSFTLRAA
jgi:two-component system sensor histidine kinase/response regulator